MSKTLEFFFDFGSPTAYLAYKRLGQLAAEYPLQVVYRPMLLGGVFQATGNSTPVAVPAKAKYMLESDLPRFVRRYGVPFRLNPHFPINTLNLMRGMFAAEDAGCADGYREAVFAAVWVEQENMGDPEVVTRVLRGAGLDAEALVAGSRDPAIKARLIEATDAAVARGVFGAPTLFMDDEMYFGQDRLDFIAEALQA